MAERLQLDPCALEPGDVFDAAGARVRVLDVVYPIHPLTGRGLFRVHKTDVGLDYALKLFELDKNPAPAIAREVIALNKLHNPERFPRAHAFQSSRAWAVLLLDWMEGAPLGAQFKTAPVDRSDVELRLRVVQELCSVVDLVHRARLLHRDLKPDNVLHRRSAQRQPSLALIDFGLTAEARREVEGTPGFQAPEQHAARPHNLGPATDIFAIAQIAFWLLTGKPRVLHANDNFSDWSELCAGSLQAACPYVRPELEQVLLRALRFAPGTRQRSALDLRRDLGSALAVQP